MSQQIAAELDKKFTLEEVGELTLKGLTQPVVAFNVTEEGRVAGMLADPQTRSKRFKIIE